MTVSGGLINLGNTITTSGGAITMTGPVTLTASATLDTTNGGVTAAGANITFSSTINGAFALILKGGTAGTVSFGAVGGITPLSALTEPVRRYHVKFDCKNNRERKLHGNYGHQY